MTLGQALKLIRVGKNIKQQEVANRTKLSVGYISLLERDKRDPNWGVVLSLCNALKISPVLVFLLLDQNHPALEKAMPIATLEIWKNISDV